MKRAAKRPKAAPAPVKPERPRGWKVTRESFVRQVGSRGRVSGRFIGVEAVAHVVPEFCSAGEHLRCYGFDVFCHTWTDGPYRSTGGRFARGDARSIGEARKASERFVREALDGKPARGMVGDLPWAPCAACEKAAQKSAPKRGAL